MTKEISFYSAKGGVGKTTFAVNFFHFLVGQGRRVDFVDLDPQASARAFIDDPHYSRHAIRVSRSEVIIYDYPPGATLSQTPQGLVVLICCPSRLSVADTYRQIASRRFARYGVVLNRFASNSASHRGIKDDLLRHIRKHQSHESRCLFYSVKAEHKAIQNAENRCLTLFNAPGDVANSIYNFNKAQAEMRSLFDTILNHI